MSSRKLLALSATVAAAMISAPFFGAAQHALAGFRDFSQVNNSSYAIVRMDLVPTDADNGVWDYTTNLELQNPLQPGDSTSFAIDDSWSPGECMFDIRIVDSGGNDTVTSGIDLCTGGRTLYYSNS